MRIIKEFSSKPFKYGLFIGIGIWLIGLIGLQLCISSEYTVARYDSFLLFYPPIRTVGFLLIFFFVVYMIYPLLEEYIFRFWAQKKNYLAILSYSLICIIIFIFLRNWIITIAFIVLFAIVHFILKNDIRKVGIFLLSSTAFAAIHTTTWPAFSIGWIFCFCIFFGMGLILSFTIINYDFGTTIIVRIVFNVLLFANLFISPSYETENYNFYISPIEEKSWTNVEVNNDTVICVTSGVNITAFIGLAYKIPASENMPFPWVPSCSPIGFEIDKSCFSNRNSFCRNKYASKDNSYNILLKTNI